MTFEKFGPRIEGLEEGDKKQELENQAKKQKENADAFGGNFGNNKDVFGDKLGGIKKTLNSDENKNLEALAKNYDKDNGKDLNKTFQKTVEETVKLKGQNLTVDQKQLIDGIKDVKLDKKEDLKEAIDKLGEIDKILGVANGSAQKGSEENKKADDMKKQEENKTTELENKKKEIDNLKKDYLKPTNFNGFCTSLIESCKQRIDNKIEAEKGTKNEGEQAEQLEFPPNQK